MKAKDIFLLVFGILLFIFSYWLDASVNLFFRNIRLPLLEPVFSIITNFGVVSVVMLAIPSLVLYKNKRKSVYLLCWAFIISVLLAFILKFIILRQRPAEALNYHFFNVINYSFPSTHAMAVFSLLPILINYLPKQKNFWIAAAFIVSFTRIYFGFHFLSDVVFGALFGYYIGKYLLGLHKDGKLWFI